MNKTFMLILAVIAAGGGWILLKKYRIVGLDQIQLVERGAGEQPPTQWNTSPPVRRSGDTIRLASFNIQVLGRTKISKPHVVEILARIIRRFDVIAIQEIRSSTDDVMPQLIEAVNVAGRSYDFVIGPRQGRTHNTEHYAYVFDTASVEVDRAQLYSIEDPDDLLHRPPWIAWFRVRGPAEDQAFTFSLINVHTDPDQADEEINWLDDVVRQVRGDGRGEDDVILLGDLNASDDQLGELARMPGATWSVHRLPTNTRKTRQYDNVLFQLPATREYTGNGGVFDFLREYNLSEQQALEVSDHLPVWGEFSIYEGGVGGSVAAP